VSNVDVERLQGLNILLKALGDGKVPLLDGNSSIGFCLAQSHQGQSDNLLIDEVAITRDVFLSKPAAYEKMFDSVGALDSLVWLHIVDWI
jgi:hypothetical protein